MQLKSTHCIKFKFCPPQKKWKSEEDLNYSRAGSIPFQLNKQYLTEKAEKTSQLLSSTYQ